MPAAVGLMIGLVLAVMPAASPAYADRADDQAAKEVATTRCEQVVQTVAVLPDKWKESCANRLTADLMGGAAKTGGWLQETCKRWVPDLPLIGDPCEKLVSLLKGAYEEFQKRAEELRNGVNAVLNPVDTALNNLSETIGNGLKSLMDKVITEMVHLSSPNLQSKAFVTTYAAGAGIGMFVLVLMLARVFYRASAGDISGDELANSLWRWVPTAVVLVMFGPALGYLLTALTNAASMSIVKYFAGDVASLAVKLQTMVVLSNTSLIPGGPLVAIVIMLLALGGVIGLLGGLLVQLLALYLTGAVMAVAFVLLVDPETRPKALKVPLTWVGLSLVKPLLFFMVGAVGRFADSAFSVNAIKDDGMRSLVTALVAALALLILGVAPWSLLKFAPALPSGSGERFSRASRSSSTGALGNLASSTMMQLSYRRLQGAPGSAGDAAAPSGPEPNGVGTAQGAQQRTTPQQQSAAKPGEADRADAANSSPGRSTEAASGAGTPASAEGGAAGVGQGSAAGAASGASAGAASGAGGAATAGAAGATAATGGLAAAALIGVQAADAAKRKAEDVAHRASDTAGE